MLPPLIAELSNVWDMSMHHVVKTAVLQDFASYIDIVLVSLGVSASAKICM